MAPSCFNSFSFLMALVASLHAHLRVRFVVEGLFDHNLGFI